MAADRLIPALSISLTLGLVIAMLLFVRQRRLPLDLVGRVTADAYLAMLRAMLLLLTGLALALGVTVAAPAAFLVPLRWIAIGLIALGGVAFVVRAALYLLRIKPELDRLSEALPPAAAVASRGVRHDRDTGERGDQRRVSNR